MYELVFRGRLGNQMFQYAYGLTLAARRGCALTFNDRWYYSQRSETFELWRFTATGLKPVTLLTEIVGRVSERLPGRKTLPDYDMYESRFEPAAMDVPAGRRLNGWFQSLRYFDEQADEVRRRLDLAPFVLTDDLAALRSQAGDRPLVAVHVRRGDYLNNPDFFLGDYDAYYARALVWMGDELSQKPFLVILSDDPDWCRQWDLLKDQPHAVYDPGPRLALNDMAMMAACDHNIITNSSFSWWGAWLGAPRSRRVVMPKQWFPKRSTDECGMDVPGWAQL